MAIMPAAQPRVLFQWSSSGPPRHGGKVRMSATSLHLITSYRISTRPVKTSFTAYSNDQGLEESFEADASSASSKEASLKTNLTRRNMIVQFTCKSCGASTQRRISRVAYERGTVFVQMAKPILLIEDKMGTKVTSRRLILGKDPLKLSGEGHFPNSADIKHHGSLGNIIYSMVNFSKVVGDFSTRKGGKHILDPCN